MPPVAVDPGSRNIRAQAGQGPILEEPAIVAVDAHRDKIIGVGEAAARMVGRTAPHIRPIRPLRDGVLADHDLACAMLSHILRRALGWRRFVSPRVVLAVSPRSTMIERRALKEAATRAGVRNPVLVEAPLAAAIGAGIDIYSAHASALVHLGGGSTEIAIVSMGKMLAHQICTVGGEALDRAIGRHLGDIAIDPGTAEQIKIHLGSATGMRKGAMEVLARWRDSGLPRKIVISAEQLRGALDVPLAEIRECVLDALESTSPEVAADIAESGLILSGGGALLHGIADMLSEATGLPARVADDPATCVLRGARKVTGRSEQK